MCWGMALTLSCLPSPQTVSTQILHLSLLFLTWPRQAVRRQAGVHRDCTRFMTWHAELRVGQIHRWSDSVCMCVSVCVCPQRLRMCWSVPGHAVWINYTLLEVAETRACSKEKVRAVSLCLVSSPEKRRRWLVLNYESNLRPSSILGEGVDWLNEPRRAACLPFVA